MTSKHTILILLSIFLVQNVYSSSHFNKLNTDAWLDTIELIKKYHYSAELHEVTTDDGFILQMQRIPYGLSHKTSEPNKRPILIVHGLTESGADYVNNGKDSLAFMLADAGYDVWLGNIRGSIWSQRHLYLDKTLDAEKYWDFSFNEHGLYDIPAKIDYILNITDSENLFYIGHSQGTSSFFAMLSERPEYNAKIRLMNAFAPVAFMTNAKNKIFKIFAKYLNATESIFKNFLHYQILPPGKINTLSSQICSLKPFDQVCADVLSLIVGNEIYTENMDIKRIPVYLTNTPSGSSAKQVLHYTQLKRTEKFMKYDYGAEQNMQLYGQIIPPEYDLNKITAPIGIYYSISDSLTDHTDVKKLVARLGSVVLAKQIDDANFSHLDFMWHKNAPNLLYKPLIEHMKNF